MSSLFAAATTPPSGDDAVEEGLFAWLSEQWWTPWVACALFTAVGFWMVRSLVIHRGRARAIARAANAAAMRYRAQDGHGLSRVPFQHFASGDGGGWTAVDVVTHTGRDGAVVHAFDVRTWVEFDVTTDHDGQQRLRRRRPGVERSAISHVIRRHRGATRSAAMVRVPVNGPRLVVARENVASKLFARATRIDLDVESEAFNRSYHVICENRDFARTMLDARMVDLMVQTDGRVSFEFLGSWALLHTVQLEPELLPGLARFAAQVPEVVARLAIERWPAGPQAGLRATTS